MAFFTAGVGPAWLSQIILFLLRRMLGLVLVVVTVVPAAAQSPELHRAVKAGDLDGLTKLREELVRTVRKMQPGSVFRDCEQCPEMVVVPAGRVRMGDVNTAVGDRDEHPVHEVTISEPFAVGVDEVTREAFGRFVEATGYSTKNSCWTLESDEWEERTGRHWRDPGFTQTARDPVVCVSWDDAQAYIRWLSRETGQSYRLLSEAEWEYVTRAESTTKFPWGNEIGTNRANCEGCSSQWGDESTAPVGSFEPNVFFDAAGNVWEWVEDCWNDSYSGAPSDGRAWTSGNCSLRLRPGGSWNINSWVLRSAYRYWIDSGNRYYFFGFRVARTLVR